MLEPLAAMMVKKIRPLDDEISMNEAYRSYGRAWVEDQRRRGNITPRSRGNRLILSRSELETVRAVCDQTPEVIFKRSVGRRRAKA